MHGIRIGLRCLALVLTLGLYTSASGQLVNRYTFDHPVEGNPAREQDLGSDKTPIDVFNGAQRVEGGAFPGSGLALQSKPIEGDSNNDHKAGTYFSAGSEGPGASTMKGTAKVTGISIMGWFKPTQAPTRTTSMTGILRGDEGAANPDPHAARALFEIENIGGGIRIVALARQRDTDQRRKIRSTRTIAEDLPTDQWSHIAATFNFDTGSITLFRNGELVPTIMTEQGSWSLTDGTDTTSNTPALGIKIGGQMEGDTTPFTGLIDEIRVYNVELPATGVTSIQSIYREQAGPPTTQPAAPAPAARGG